MSSCLFIRPADCHKIVLQLEEKQIPYVIEKM